MSTSTLNDFDFTAQQFGVLRRLYEEDGLPARELVVKLFSDSSTIDASCDATGGGFGRGLWRPVYSSRWR